MSDELDLDAIEDRANAATPGPWTWRNTLQTRPNMGTETDSEYFNAWRLYCAANPSARVLCGDAGTRRDAAFIAHARQDVPDLVDECRRLRAQNAVLAAAVRADERAICALEALDCAEQRGVPEAERDALIRARTQALQEYDAAHAEALAVLEGKP